MRADNHTTRKSRQSLRTRPITGQSADRRLTKLTILQCSVMLLGSLLPIQGWAQDTPDYYRQNCMNCHTIGGGRLTGPDLKDVAQRRDAEWLINFMQNPRAVVDSGDAYAVKLVEESRGVVMPVAPGMSRYRAEQIIKLIEAESKLEKSQFQGVQVSNEPFTELDRIAGRNIFVGMQALTNRGTACNACHSMHDLSALGGGRLGPDLTRVYERLKGRQAMSAWLMAPATETMQPVFKNHPLEAAEIHALTAYFEASASQPEADASVNRIAFLMLGLAVAAATVFLFDAIWRGRFYGVRRPLLEAGVSAVHLGSKRAPAAQASSSSTLAAAAGELNSPRGHS